VLTQATNIDDLMRRHLELVIRLHDGAYPALALEAALSALQHEPPSSESPLLQFLIHPVLTTVCRSDAAALQFRQHLEANRELRQGAQWWLRFYLDGRASESADSTADRSGELLRQLMVVREFLERQPSSEQVNEKGTGTSRPPDGAMLRLKGSEPVPFSLHALPLPPGCTRCVVVEPTGEARVTRIHVRLGRWGRLDQAPIVGQVVPGAKAALDAAQQYLAGSGCAPIDGLQAEVLVEGMFRPIQGESLALAVFVAAVSARLRLAVPSHWAFSGAIGTSSADSPAGAVMPVNEIRAKLHSCGQAGCLHLMVPAHLLPEGVGQLAHGPCALAAVTTTVEAVERVLPEHCLPESPRVAGWREYLGQFLQSLLPGDWLKGDWLRRPEGDWLRRPEGDWLRRPEERTTTEQVNGDGACPLFARHRAFRLVVPCFFALMLTERWLLGDYLIPEHYLGVYRAPVWLAVVLGGLAAAVMAGTIYASLRVVDRLLDEGATVNWWVAAALLLAGCALAWLPAQWLIRDPLAPPPREVYLEHRTIQGWKDTTVLFLYALIFFVSPYSRVRLAERAASARRFRWAREILEGRRWANATFPVASVPLLVVIASVALMGLGYLDWQSLTDPSRVGSGPENGPWRAIHIIGRSQLYLISCIAVLWWLGRSAHRVLPAGAEDTK